LIFGETGFGGILGIVVTFREKDMPSKRNPLAKTKISPASAILRGALRYGGTGGYGAARPGGAAL